jgi:hypothetical protein
MPGGRRRGGLTLLVAALVLGGLFISTMSLGGLAVYLPHALRRRVANCW